MAFTADEILALIQKEVAVGLKKQSSVHDILKKIETRAAGYSDAAAYADKVGEICAGAFKKFCTGEYIGAEYVTQEIADGTIPPMLQETYSMINDVTGQIQTLLNQQASLGLKAQSAEFDAEAAQNLANKVVNVSRAEGLERAQWVLDEPVKTFARQVVDNDLKANADFQGRAGLVPTIKRTLVGGCCEWCAALAGTFDYGTEPRPDFYRRHERCRCVIELSSQTGRRKKR